MKVHGLHLVNRSGVAIIETLTAQDLQWLFREETVSDFGLDAQVEIVEQGRATGRLLALQIKSGESYFNERTEEGFVYRGDPDHLGYWLNHALPVIVVICRPSSHEAYWQVIAQETIVRTASAWKMTIPFANRFGEKSKLPLQALFAKRMAAHRPTSSSDRATRQDLSVDLASVLPLLVPNPDVLDIQRFREEVRSERLRCIASLDGLLAILRTENTVDGRVLVLRRCPEGWRPAAHFQVITKYAETLPSFFVLGQVADCLVIRHPVTWGSGIYLEEEKWYLVSEQTRLALEYPVYGYVSGWDLPFDRRIEGCALQLPNELCEGAAIEVLIRAEYTTKRADNDEDTRLFELKKSMRLHWNEESRKFLAAHDTELKPEEAFAFYNDGHAQFAVRNLNKLLQLAQHGDNAQCVWLTKLAEMIGSDERYALLEALRQRNSPA